MKNIFRLLKTGLVLSLLAFSFASCSEDRMDEINTDYDSAKDATAKYLLPDIILRTSQELVGGDFNTYLGSYVEYWTGTHNQLYQAEIRGGEVRSASTFNNGWATLFDIIRNCKVVIEKFGPGSVETEGEQPLAIAKTMLAYALSFGTDMFGDIPYSEVGDAANLPYPRVEKQQDLYTEIFHLLDEAESIFAQGPASITNYDLMFKGSNASWIKFINGLRARYTLRLIERSANKNGDLEKVVEYVSDSFTNASEQSSMIYAGTDNQNPLFDFEWSRDGISSGTSMWNKLVERNDPRGDRVYWHSSAWVWFDLVDVEDYLAPTGSPIESQYQYAYDVFFLAETAPIHFLSYHELKFIEAEALARLGKTDEAKAALKEAVEAAFANLEINIQAAYDAPSINAYGGIDQDVEVMDEAEAIAAADEYFDDTVSDLFDENPLKEIMLQKYIGLWNANGEAQATYADIRRLKAEGKGDFYSLINPGRFPLRAAYGVDDVTANPNIAPLHTDAGNYVFTENVWWAGGSR